MSPQNRQLDSKWVEVNGLLMHARVTAGAAATEPPVVLVHGLSVSSRYMIPLARQLSAHFPVYALDLPGFGRSARPDKVLGITELAGVLASWLEVVGLDKIVLLGNSFGCQIIVEFGLQNPERVQRAVLVAPTPDPEARNVLQAMMRGFVDILREPVSLLPIVLYDYLIAGPKRTWQTYRNLLQDPIQEKLPHFQISTLIVRGERDPIVPQGWAEEVARLLPVARLVVLSQAAHAANFSAPALLAEVIRLFLESDDLQQGD